MPSELGLLRSKYSNARCFYLSKASHSIPQIHAICGTLGDGSRTRLPTNNHVRNAFSSAVASPSNTSSLKLPGQRTADIKDIVANDLEATIEAHRVTNTARLIRKFGRPEGYNLIKYVRPEKEKSPKSHGAPRKYASTPDTSNPRRSIRTVVERPDYGKRNTPLLVRYVNTNLEPGSPENGRIARPPLGPSSLPKLPRISSGTDREIRSKTDFGFRKPWTENLRLGDVDAMSRLDGEIRAFEAYMKPTNDEEASTRELINHARSVVASISPAHEVVIHGSRYTGLASWLSDIDFCVSLPGYEKDPLTRGPSLSRPEARRAGEKFLRSIMSALGHWTRYQHIHYIRGARVPLVATLDINTGLTLQFSTLAPFLPSREFTMYYLSEFTSLRYLYILLRHTLLIRELTTVHDGGIGSYPLLIMIVTALKHAPPAFDRQDLGTQLSHVLKFWSEADLYNNGYSCDPPTTFSKTNIRMSVAVREERMADPLLDGIDFIRKPRPNKTFLLCLQDPGNPRNDLGKNAHSIKHIQGVFLAMHEHLMSQIEKYGRVVDLGDEHQKKGLLDDFSFLEPMVGADYTVFEQRRRKLSKAHLRASPLTDISEQPQLPHRSGLGKKRAGQYVRSMSRKKDGNRNAPSGLDLVAQDKEAAIKSETEDSETVEVSNHPDPESNFEVKSLNKQVDPHAEQPPRDHRDTYL